ncbi:hypothetical protein MYX77_02180 [Acidobacteriia bacterium AH_259_A11_L15]|nr:hypothetical protein [Acidobacteriia bacterium AH_259_A11_L15]
MARGKTDNAYASWWVMWWGNFLRTPRNKIGGKLSYLDHLVRQATAQGDGELAAAQLRVKKWADEEELSLSEAGLDRLAFMVSSGAYCRDFRAELERDRAAQRLVYEGTRRLYNWVARSCRYFEQRCAREQRVVRFTAFRRTMFRLASQRQALFSQAARQAVNQMLRRGFKAVAKDWSPRGCKHDQLRCALDQIKTKPWLNKGTETIRCMFYAGTGGTPVRKILRERPRLRRDRYRSIDSHLVYFNLVGYLIYVVKQPAEEAYRLADSFVRGYDAADPAYGRSLVRRFLEQVAPGLSPAFPGTIHQKVL